jgi:hypothetical protein
MRLSLRSAVMVLVVFFGFSVIADAALVRVPKRYNYLTFFGGYSSPIGEYDGVGDLDFSRFGTDVSVDGSDAYDATYHFGFNYGQLRNNHIAFGIGFRYTDVPHSIHELEVDIVLIEDVIIRQYDLDLDLNYFPLDLTKEVFSPYVGVGINAGITHLGGDRLESRYYTDIAASVNGGMEFVVGRFTNGFVTLASINSYTFWNSQNRPKYINIGGGLKYYFSM